MRLKMLVERAGRHGDVDVTREKVVSRCVARKIGPQLGKFANVRRTCQVLFVPRYQDKTKTVSFPPVSSQFFCDPVAS